MLQQHHGGHCWLGPQAGQRELISCHHAGNAMQWRPLEAAALTLEARCRKGTSHQQHRASSAGAGGPHLGGQTCSLLCSSYLWACCSPSSAGWKCGMQGRGCHSSGPGQHTQSRGRLCCACTLSHCSLEGQRLSQCARQQRYASEVIDGLIYLFVAQGCCVHLRTVG